jgi:hypothetical protein
MVLMLLYSLLPLTSLPTYLSYVITHLNTYSLTPVAEHGERSGARGAAAAGVSE